MVKSVYDVMYKTPKLHKKLPPREEALASAVIASGKMRLDADTESNFVRLLAAEDHLDLTYTLREIAGKELRPIKQKQLFELLCKQRDPVKARELVNSYFKKLEEDIAKKHPVNPKTEKMIARALVLCNALPVIELIHLEGAEIFISFGHSVGDVMDVARWEKSGKNSGLQAVGGGENAVYVSCGGNPFLSKEEARHSGDGKAALARFMIIAAQETGHNGDMIRNENGTWSGRHSALGWQREPNPKAGAARLADIARTEQLWSKCREYGLNRIARWESDVQFFRKVKVRNARSIAKWLGCKLGWLYLRLVIRGKAHMPLPKLQRATYPCQQLQAFFSDQLANLAPEHEVYRRKNPKEEEAVAVIEAVARVPQQVVKWGHHAVRATAPALYDFYYGEVVPACEIAIKYRKALLHRSKNGE
jgi:hypothetical protein